MFNSCFCDASTILHFLAICAHAAPWRPLRVFYFIVLGPFPFSPLPVSSLCISLSHSLVFFRSVILTVSTSSAYSGFSHCLCSISTQPTHSAPLYSLPPSVLSLSLYLTLSVSLPFILFILLPFLSLFMVPYIFLSLSFSLIHFSITFLLTLAPFLLDILYFSPFVCILLTSVGVKCSGFVFLWWSGFGQITGPDAATLKHNLHNIFWHIFETLMTWIKWHDGVKYYWQCPNRNWCIFILRQ